MASMITAQLQNGMIFGDIANAEYIYIPAGECGALSPVPVYEHEKKKDDISLEQALSLITRRSLKPVKHPRLGQKAF